MFVVYSTIPPLFFHRSGSSVFTSYDDLIVILPSRESLAALLLDVHTSSVMRYLWCALRTSPRRQVIAPRMRQSVV